MPPAAPVAAPAASRRAAWRAACFHATTQKGAVAMFDQAVVSGTTFATSVIVGHMGSRATSSAYSTLPGPSWSWCKPSKSG